MHHAAPVMVVSGAEVYSFAYSCIRYTALTPCPAPTVGGIQYTAVYSLQVYSAYRYTAPTPPL